jgi:uncharacterized protein
VKIADANPPSSFRLIVEGTGKIGFMRGEGLLTLSAAAPVPEVGPTLAAVIRDARNGASATAGPADTAVCYEGDMQVGGTIANVGQRLIDTTAKMLIRRFFEKLSQEAAG